MPEKVEELIPLAVGNDADNPVDEHVGKKLHILRTDQGYSADFIAKSIGLSVRELHQIEQGISRISIVHLNSLCTLMNVSIADFFNTDLIEAEHLGTNDRDETPSPEDGRILLSHFLNIKSKKHRKILLEQAEFFAKPTKT